MILGVTGYLCAGKDTLADFLIKKGFRHISLSDILRKELKQRGKEVNRNNLVQLGNDLRSFLGPGILAEKALSMIEEGHDYVISSIGTLGEIKVLQRHEGFKLIFVDAPQKLRFQRMRSRRRENDPKIFSEFKKLEEKESKGGGKSLREFDKCRKEADIIIINDGSPEDLFIKTELMLGDLYKKAWKRPGWDEYFLEISRTVAKRSTCDRGRSGAVIVKDRQILATGYVGSASGQPHCDEVGHLFQSVKHSDGQTRKHCVRTIHAEQNAIVQAAKNGVPIDKSTLYCKMEPCAVCAKLIVNAGIKRVVCENKYHAAQETRYLFRMAGVELKVLNEKTENYADMR